MSLDSIVSVNISAGTSQPSRRGFGTPLLLGFHTRFTDNVRTYTSLSGMIDDGFTVNDPVYLMASAVMSQNPRPEKIKVGRLPTPPLGSFHTTQIDCSGVSAGDTISMTVRSPFGSVTQISIPFNTDASTTASSVAAAIDAIADMSATSLAGVVTAAAEVDGQVWFFEDVSGPAEVLDVTGDWGYDAQLVVIDNEDPDFYAVAIDVNSSVNISDVAAWAASSGRIAAFGPQVTNPSDYSVTAAPLKSGNNDRCFSIVKKTSRSQFPECRMLGEALPWYPGSQTWAFKSPNGLTADPWSASDLTTIENDNSNHATTVAGLSVVRKGITHGGEYIDVVRGLDWLKARLQERVYGILVNNRKVPFTDTGIQMIVSEIKGQLLDAEARGVLTPGSSSVTAPLAANVSAADKAARHLTGVEFTAQLAGAVHKVTILGAVTV